jgi:hypothetical protein
VICKEDFSLLGLRPVDRTDHNHRKGRLVFAHMGEHPPPVEARHHHIGNDQMGRRGGNHLQRNKAIRRGLDPVPLILEKDGEDRENDRLIVDDQDVTHTVGLQESLRDDDSPPLARMSWANLAVAPMSERGRVVAFNASRGHDVLIMHDNGSRLRPELVQTTDPTVVQITIPITEAAAHLGISADAIGKRIQRGKLTGHKTDTGWTVDWIEPDSGPEIVQVVSTDASALVENLQSQVAFLRDQVRAEREARTEAERRHAAEIERRDVLLQEALEGIPLGLPAGEPSRQDRPVTQSKDLCATMRP